MHEDIQLLFILEICLIFGDVFYAFDDDISTYSCVNNILQTNDATEEDLIEFYLYRSVFIVLSVINMFAALYIICKYKLYHLCFVGNDDPIDQRCAINLQKQRKIIYFQAKLLQAPLEFNKSRDYDHQSDDIVASSYVNKTKTKRIERRLSQSCGTIVSPVTRTEELLYSKAMEHDTQTKDNDKQSNDNLGHPKNSQTASVNNSESENRETNQDVDTTNVRIAIEQEPKTLH